MRYAWLGGLALSALPMTSSTSQAHVNLSFAGPSINIGVGHHEHHDFRPFRGPAFYGGYFGPRVYFGASYYCPPAVVYAPPAVVYTTPAPVYVAPPVYAPQTYAPAPQYYQSQPVPVPQPAPANYYYGR